MLALYLMLSVTYYAQNYASIIRWSLAIANCNINFIKIVFIMSQLITVLLIIAIILIRSYVTVMPSCAYIPQLHIQITILIRS